MGQDCAIAATGKTWLQRRAPTCPQPWGVGRHPVDTAHRGALARPAPAISQSFYLLASPKTLGGTGAVAENLAHLPVATGRRRSLGLAGSLHRRQLRSGEKGGSGVGKTKISRAVAETLGAFLSVSATTRPSADTEAKGLDYKFVDTAKFDEMRQNGEFLECADIFGFSYGTLRQPVEHALADGKLVILEIDVEGAAEVKRQMPECRAMAA